MASCVLCKKDVTTGFVVCGDCAHKLESFTLSPDLAYFIDQLAEELVRNENSCTCDMCSIVGCSSQVSGVTCKNGIKVWLLDKANQFFPANKCADEIKPLSKQKDSEGTAEMDLADGIRQFYSLEIALGGRNGAFCEWSELAYELNDDHEEDYSCLVKKICDSFQSISCDFGKEIAQQLYNAHTIILPTEIRNAAKYLNAGGRIADLPGLASAGFFMASVDRERLEQVVTYINAGGNPDSV